MFLDDIKRYNKKKVNKKIRYGVLQVHAITPLTTSMSYEGLLTSDKFMILCLRQKECYNK